MFKSLEVKSDISETDKSFIDIVKKFFKQSVDLLSNLEECRIEKSNLTSLGGGYSNYFLKEYIEKISTFVDNFIVFLQRILMKIDLTLCMRLDGIKNKK